MKEDELGILSILIDNYENENFPIGMPDPISTNYFRMEQMGLKQKDLVAMIGFKSRVSEIMNKKGNLTLDMIRKLKCRIKYSNRSFNPRLLTHSQEALRAKRV